ncbi:hypothetical protein MIND_00111500 [Mycena indigotica]|uniref:DUF1446-domain-containing protein n=1 Tax=Mycena indigotica TaxID=2126181 RepID=A0A8H6WFN3_9AGAR|nr:uncharacterized protein MIND_00111500 [Mycena indigotica]KAF7315947.1 hypothetical protein MIND_00111500 [Mycena indigotica]
MKRPVRIGGASGSAIDRRIGFAQLAAGHPDDPVDVIIGDFMSEGNMTSLAGKKMSGQDVPSYEAAFVEALKLGLDDIARNGIKVVVNAGGTDTHGLYKVIAEILKQRNLSLQVAWISGDEVLPIVLERSHQEPDAFINHHTGEAFASWPYKPIFAQCYLGGMGIAAALKHGADIVVCGRVADASPVIGAAAWWHDWDPSNFEQLACSLIAGHLIECSTYVTGGNFTGFKKLEKGGRWLNLGYPIAEIGANGQVIITKRKGTGGLVSVATCTSQLLYEIQGPWYFNSDVTAIIDNISFTQVAKNRVAVTGVQSAPPPPTTKVGITGRGGFQAESNYYIVGLDAQTKARMFEQQARSLFADPAINSLNKFTLLDFQLLGVPARNPATQTAATATLRVVAQAKEAKDLAPSKFIRPMMDLIMGAYPGGTVHMDGRLGLPKPIHEYFVTRMDQRDMFPPRRKHKHFRGNNRPHRVSSPAPPRGTKKVALDVDFRPSIRAPLGSIVHARSGDKGSDANVGFFVEDRDQYEWLRRLLSIEKMIELLGDDYNGQHIDRFELPNILAIHFLLHDYLDRGVSCTSTVDFLGKNVAEFLRAREVDVPKRFLIGRKVLGKL